MGILNIIFAREFLQQEDITWALIDEFICDIIERNLSAFVANLPALWLLVVQLRKKRAASSSYGKNSSLPYYYSRNNNKRRKDDLLNDTLNSTLTTDDVAAYQEISSQQELYQHHRQRQEGQPPIGILSSSESADIVVYGNPCSSSSTSPSTDNIALTTQSRKLPVINSQEAFSSTECTSTQGDGSRGHENHIRVRTEVEICEERRLSLINNGGSSN